MNTRSLGCTCKPLKRRRNSFLATFAPSSTSRPPSSVAPAPMAGRRSVSSGRGYCLFRLLARMKWLRGTKSDPFARHPERQMERALIAQYEADLETLLPLLSPATESALKELAELPLTRSAAMAR